MYKNQQITDIFTHDQLKNAIHLNASVFETSIFINDGKGSFTRKALPVEAQFSPVYAATIGDFNNDGHPDILLGGNLYRVKPELGRYDASYGAMLEGDGHGGFRFVPARTSGLHLDGEIRDIKAVKTIDGSILVVARNNEPVQVFKITSK